jgi:hypothetical protein
MSLTLPNGSTVFIASGYGSAVTVSAVSNAAPPVATATNTFVAGDIVEITSGWSRFNSKIARVLAPTGSNFDYEGLDSTITSIYAPGSGAGSVRKITGWTQLQQIIQTSTSGGDQQFLTYQLLESDTQLRMPTVKNPFDMQIELADDPTLAGYQLASAANDDRLPRAVKIILANGAPLYYNCYVSLNRVPSMTVNQLMAVKLTLSMLNEPVRYTS